MPRTAITPVKTSRASSVNGLGNVVATEAALDAVNFNSFANSGRELLVVRNSGAGSHTLQLRAIDGTTAVGSAITILAGKSVVLGPFSVQHLGATVNVDGNHAELLAYVVTIDHKGTLTPTDL
jgi:hypothetical protein